MCTYGRGVKVRNEHKNKEWFRTRGEAACCNITRSSVLVPSSLGIEKRRCSKTGLRYNAARRYGEDKQQEHNLININSQVQARVSVTYS